MILDFIEHTKEEYLYDVRGNLNTNPLSKIEISLPGDIKIFDQPRGFCTFCKTLSKKVHSDFSYGCMGVDFYNHVDIHECSVCGWWEYVSHFSEEKDYGFTGETDEKHTETIIYAIAKHFEPSSKELPLGTLKNEILKNPRILHHIHPYKLEELAQDVFSSFYECEVKHVGQSHDGGVDLIIVLSDNPILVQVKRRESASSVESISTVRDFLGAMFIKESAQGIILSTADHFSRTSKKTVDDLLARKKLDSFELIDYKSFCSMLDIVSGEKVKGWAFLLPQNTES